MKKIATILVFIFTFQIITPVFAQESSKSNIRALQLCLDKNYSVIKSSAPLIMTNTDLKNRYEYLKAMTHMTLDFFLKQELKKLEYQEEELGFISEGYFASAMVFGAAHANTEIYAKMRTSYLANLHWSTLEATAESIQKNLLSFNRAIMDMKMIKGASLGAGGGLMLIGVVMSLLWTHQKNELLENAATLSSLDEFTSEVEFSQAIAFEDPVISDFRNYMLMICKTMNPKETVFIMRILDAKDRNEFENIIKNRKLDLLPEGLVPPANENTK